jgi:hypothetical protein
MEVTMQEVFKKHPSGALVSDHGNVIGARGRKLKAAINRYGYAVVSLRKPDGSFTRSVHRAVVETFIGPIPDMMVVNHKNGCKHDNRLSNLEVVTPSQNSKHAVAMGLQRPMSGEKNGQAKMDVCSIEHICRDIMQGKTNAEIGATHGLHERYVSLIRHKRRWKAYIPEWYVPSDSLGNSGVPVDTMIAVLADCRTALSNSEIAAKWGLDRSTISRVRSGKTWKAFAEYYNNTVVQRLSPAGEYTQVSGKAEHL